MKKKEALNYIRLNKGYVPYIGMFELYNDEDEVPQEIIDLSIKSDETRNNFIICSDEVAKQLKNLQEKQDKL